MQLMQRFCRAIAVCGKLVIGIKTAGHVPHMCAPPFLYAKSGYFEKYPARVSLEGV